LSTAEIYGNASGEINETCPLSDSPSPYGRAKIEAEKICRAYGLKGLPISVIRPSIVYGPFSKDWTVRLAERLRSGDWGKFQGIGQGICNLIYISDLVSGILLAAHAKAAIGEAFNMVGPDLLTWNEYFLRFNAALGLPELKVIPQQKARLRARLVSPLRAYAKFAKARFEKPLRNIAQKYRPAKTIMKSLETKMKLAARMTDFSLYSRNAMYRSTKAENLLGFKPKFDLAAGLKLTAAWLDLHGLAKK